ncbi:TMV resistance protein N, partial [Trifolium medium]|nr:TMV resistance protein N [Trifolium medium]
TLSSYAGVSVFWDGERHRSGDQEISTSSLNVIGDCRVAVIVFSRNYANSRYCLREWEKITEYSRTTTGLNVLFVFYDGVYPCDGRLRSGMFGEAFHNLVDRICKEEISQEGDKFMSWVEAISNKALKYSGSRYSERKSLYRNESEYISNVVERVTHVLHKKRDLFSASYTASVKSGVQDDKSFIDVSTVRGKSDLQVLLQDDLSFDIGKETEKNVPTVESRKVILEQSLQHKRVLLILDNVDKLEQLDALCGSRKWFGEGSKIIIMTRDRHLLKEHGVNHIYRVKELDESESRKLFNFDAFSQEATPGENFSELARQYLSGKVC